MKKREWYKEDWYFSVVDVIEALVENNKRPRKYWSDLKQKLILEGFVEVSEKIGQLKMLAKASGFSSRAYGEETFIQKLMDIIRKVIHS